MVPQRFRNRFFPCPVAGLLALLVLAGPLWASDGGGGSVTQLDRWRNALWAWGLFAVLLGILGRFAWKPVIKVIEEREQAIADNIAEAQKRRAESEETLAEYKAQLAEAESEIAAMIERSRKQAEDHRNEVLQKAQHEAAETVAAARDQIEHAKREALNQIYRTTASLASDLASKIVRREIRPQDHEDLVRQSIEKLRDEG